VHPRGRAQGLVILAIAAVLAPLLHAALSFSAQLLRPRPFGLCGGTVSGEAGTVRSAGGLEARTLVRAAKKKKKAELEEEVEEKPVKKKAATRKKKAEPEPEEAEEKPAKKKAATRKKKAEPDPEPEEAEEKPANKKVAAKAEPKDDRDPKGFYPGDRVSAKYHKDAQWYEAVVLYQKDDGVWDISWDEPDEGEQITSVSNIKLVKRGPVGHPELENVPLAPGDKVWALFLEDQNWYEAVLLKMPEADGGKYTVRWDDPDGCPPTAQLERHDIKLKLRKV